MNNLTDKYLDEGVKTPTSLEIGKTYKTLDGGSIKITSIRVDSFHLHDSYECWIDYTWISPEGKKGKSSGSADALKQDYF